MRSKCKWASAVLVAQPWYEDCFAQVPVGAHGASRQRDINMIQYSQNSQVTTDLGEEAPMHHNVSYEDTGNTDIEFVCYVRQIISEGTRLTRSVPTAPGLLTTELGQFFYTR